MEENNAAALPDFTVYYEASSLSPWVMWGGAVAAFVLVVIVVIVVRRAKRSRQSDAD